MTITAGTDRLSIPAPGRTLLVEAEQWGKPVREAVELTKQRLTSASVVGPESRPTGASLREHADDGMVGWPDERVAWFLVNAWLLSRRAGVVDGESDLMEGLRWFFGGFEKHQLAGLADDSILVPLMSVDILSDGFLDLLPYLLDADGLATRRAVLRDPAISSTRAAKKRRGIVYTPADVVEHMVGWVLESPTRGEPVVLDPACGTGAYLVAALKTLAGDRLIGRLAIAASSLYGIDINPISLDTCAFVLLHHALEDVRQAVNPLAAWRAVRMNLALHDTLSLEPTADLSAAEERSKAADRRRAAKRDLLDGTVEGRDSGGATYGGASVGDLFPEVVAFDAIVTNPPYAPLGRREDFAALARRFDCLRQAAGPSTDMYLPFTEFCWRLAAEQGGRAAVVVPLSVAFSQRPAYRALRRQMTRNSGAWVVSFYDRTPDALFGDDVKQRTAILRFDARTIAGPSIRTGPLQRWTSRNRHTLFVDEPGVRVDAADIGRVLPKVATESESNAYHMLRSRLLTLETSILEIVRCSASTEVEHPPELFVAGTAYNWISVALRPPALVPGVEVTSQSPLHRLRFGSAADAELAYAVLTSRLVYWLWRVEGDGFHVPRWFLTQVPISLDTFADEDGAELGQLGRQLWENVCRKPVVSTNGGSTSVSFDPATDERTLHAIDMTLCRSLNLPAGFGAWLYDYMEKLKRVERPLRAARQAEEVPSWS